MLFPLQPPLPYTYLIPHRSLNLTPLLFPLNLFIVAIDRLPLLLICKTFTSTWPSLQGLNRHPPQTWFRHPPQTWFTLQVLPILSVFTYLMLNFLPIIKLIPLSSPFSKNLPVFPRLFSIHSGVRPCILKLLLYKLLELGAWFLCLLINGQSTVNGSTRSSWKLMGQLNGIRPGWWLRDTTKLKALITNKPSPLSQKWSLSVSYSVWQLCMVGISTN